MKNLNKYTKQELINKFKSLENKANPKSLINQIKVYLSQTWGLIITFKNLLLKITLFSLIVQFVKKYKLFRKVWFTINSMIMVIFGISILENSLFDFITNIISEIRFIAWNITDYLTNTNFYNYLSKLFTKNDVINNNEIKNTIKNKIKNKDIDYKISDEELKIKKIDTTKEPAISRLRDWIKPQTDIIEQSESNFKKYLYLTGIIIAGSLAWYYSDEIKTNFTGLMEWLMSFRTGPGGGTANDSNNDSTPIGTNIPIESSESNSPIELIDKGKTRVLSPSASFEDLNQQIKESWSERPLSPSSSSSSSTETITPLNINTSEEILNQSSESSLSINIIDFIRKNWKNRLDVNTQSKIKFIETTIGTDLDDDSELKLVNYFADIISEYNKDVEAYNYLKTSNENVDNAEGLKQSLFYLRKWISENKEIILPNSTIIKTGTIIDSPELLNKDIFE